MMKHSCIFSLLFVLLLIGDNRGVGFPYIGTVDGSPCLPQVGGKDGAYTSA